MNTSDPTTSWRKFVAPEFVFGWGCRELAARSVASLGARHVLLVSGPHIEAAGWVADVENNLSAAGLRCTRFLGISPNPRTYEVEEGAELYQSAGCDAIVALGGGSPLDAAKGIGIVATNMRPIASFEGVDMVSVPGPPLVCLPTTAGSASEVSQFAILLDPDRRTKITIISKSMVPDKALIDPAMTVTMDPTLTATTGMDALTHAVEALVSNAHSSLTDLHALEAIRLIKTHLGQAVQSPEDRDARIGMLLGSLQAGLAFSNTSLGVVHAMSHSLGGHLDLPHGLCNAILLPVAVAANFASAPEQYRKLAQVLEVELPGEDLQVQADALASAILGMGRDMGIHQQLQDIGVASSDLAHLAANALADPCMVTNPRDMTQAEVEQLYGQVL